MCATLPQGRAAVAASVTLETYDPRPGARLGSRPDPDSTTSPHESRTREGAPGCQPRKISSNSWPTLAGRPSRRGWSWRPAGNLSARLPGSDEFLVTGTGTYLDRLDAGSFSLVGLDGGLRGGNPDRSSEWKLHQRTYLVRPDVNAVIHLHPQYRVLLDALGHQVRLISLDQAYYVRKIARVPYFPSGSDELADAAAEAARDCNAVILGFHGCSCLGDTIAMGFRRAQNLEQAAEVTTSAASSWATPISRSRPSGSTAWRPSEPAGACAARVRRRAAGRARRALSPHERLLHGGKRRLWRKAGVIQIGVAHAGEGHGTHEYRSSKPQTVIPTHCGSATQALTVWP